MDLLNRSSRFKSQQITQKVQGEAHRLCNQVHFRGCFILDEAGPPGRGSGARLSVSFGILPMKGFIPGSRAAEEAPPIFPRIPFGPKRASRPLAFPVWSDHRKLLLSLLCTCGLSNYRHGPKCGSKISSLTSEQKPKEAQQNMTVQKLHVRLSGV